jgi:hypothetical protein
MKLSEQCLLILILTCVRRSASGTRLPGRSNRHLTNDLMRAAGINAWLLSGSSLYVVRFTFDNRAPLVSGPRILVRPASEIVRFGLVSSVLPILPSAPD